MIAASDNSGNLNAHFDFTAHAIANVVGCKTKMVISEIDYRLITIFTNHAKSRSSFSDTFRTEYIGRDAEWLFFVLAWRPLPLLIRYDGLDRL